MGDNASLARAAQEATAQAAQEGAHLLHELIGDAVHGEHQLDGSAALAAVRESALYHVAGCQLQVCVLQHYAGVLAAQLLRGQCRPDLAAMRKRPIHPAPAGPRVQTESCSNARAAHSPSSCKSEEITADGPIRLLLLETPGAILRRLDASLMSQVPGLLSRLDEIDDDAIVWQTGSTVLTSADDSWYQYPTAEPRV